MNASHRRPRPFIAACIAALSVGSVLVPGCARAEVLDASSEALGIFPAGTFRVATGRCPGCAASPQALWYFEQDVFGVASGAKPSAGTPPLVWLGSGKVANDAILAPDGRQVDLGTGGKVPFAIVPKLPTNLSYYNADTTAFFARRPLRLRGDWVSSANGGKAFAARTIWPQDFVVEPGPLRPLEPAETLRGLVIADRGGARRPFSTRVLWSRGPTQDWHGKSIIGLMLNGAQGDDDESLGGHFGIVTGRYTDGSMHGWLMNNFYGIDAISEKGIVAGVTPLDKYLADLNSGQSYYRPSAMLVAVLRNDEIARAYQTQIDGVFDRFYRHDIEYDHANDNCAGLSSDGFRAIGWNIPARGNGDWPKAVPAYAVVAMRKRSLSEGRAIYDYLTAETSRLYPAVAFDTMGGDLLALAQHKTTRPLDDFERRLADQLEAIVFVHIPQIPSSRAFGFAPVASFDEYRDTAPADRAKWKIVPTSPRPPMPVALRSTAPSPARPFPVPWPVAGAALAMLALLVQGARWIRRRGWPRG